MGLAIVLALLTFAATLAGGFFVLRFKSLPVELIGFSAGILVAVACFDLLPHGFEQFGFGAILSSLAGYGLLYAWHHYRLKQDISHLDADTAGQADLGLLGAGTLVLHSLVDGVALGVGLSDGHTGLGVALAIILHDFCDGVSTVTLVLRTRKDPVLARLFLAANAIAPVVGAVVVITLGLSEQSLDWLLTFFAGTFLYIGLHQLFPAALQSAHDRLRGLSVGMSAAVGILAGWGMTMPGS
ncbi:MAG: ZIP family metal transporter [Gemmatimonadaceae bacterium]|nr:ZIP family metal transporter [Gloeobacterales cyanobacterium ES-bin-141]